MNTPYQARIDQLTNRQLRDFEDFCWLQNMAPTVALLDLWLGKGHDVSADDLRQAQR